MLDADALRSTYLATGLTDEQLNTIGALAQVQNFNSGHVIARCGDAAEEMFVILSGEVRVTTHDGDALGEIKAGNIVGEIALVDARPRAANVVCVGAVTVGAFNLKQLRGAMMKDKELGIIVMANIASVLAQRLRHADAMIDQLADKTQDVWAHAMG
ncbi:MAG: cyclic nucleotide-binding domain-containing protein [Fimbriimonadaceae bacterium]|nr:cyclic nucleotide-binding domain-containing protein [Fimbriimonadaceae bacterium]